MSRTMTAQDRSSLIRLASSLDKGSQERKDLLRLLKFAEEREKGFDEGAAKSASGSKVYTLTTPKGPREFTDLKELIAYQDSLWGASMDPVIRWTDANGVSHKLALRDFFRQGFRSHRERLKLLEKMIQEKELKV